MLVVGIRQEEEIAKLNTGSERKGETRVTESQMQVQFFQAEILSPPDFSETDSYLVAFQKQPVSICAFSENFPTQPPSANAPLLYGVYPEDFRRSAN